MTDEELIKELLTMSRQSDDAAKANEFGAAAHQTEYDSYFTVQAQDRTDELHSRTLELYEYAINWSRNAKRLRKEAETFRLAAQRIADLS